MYLTYKINKKTTYEQQNLYDCILNDTAFEPQKTTSYPEYFTVKTDKLVQTDFNKTQYTYLISKVLALAEKADCFLKDGIDKHYSSFKIPKHNGKFRQIDAPDEELKQFLRLVKDTFQNAHIHPHNAAFAYVQQRSNKHAVEKHQQNESKWFLHIDLQDFFGNCTEEFIHKQLKQVYPFCLLYNETPKIEQAFRTIISAALYKGRLPQGTPLSPYLTNIIMIPIDDALYQLCKQWKKQHFVYTRYADDIDISSRYNFNYQELITVIKTLLADTPLTINTSKVHYGSTAGRNWHLGLMLNQQNNITVGYKKKRLIKQKLLNFCTNKHNWTLDDVQVFLGELAYFRNIEPEYHDYLLKDYSSRYNNDVYIIVELRSMLVNMIRTMHA